MNIQRSNVRNFQSVAWTISTTNFKVGMLIKVRERPNELSFVFGSPFNVPGV